MKTLTVDDQKRIRIPDAKPRGRVSLERRRAIRSSVRDMFRLSATD